MRTGEHGAVQDTVKEEQGGIDVSRYSTAQVEIVIVNTDRTRHDGNAQGVASRLRRLPAVL